MDKIIMRGKEYKVTSNENQYDLEINENTLLLKRGEEVYITLDLDKVCLGTKLEILKNVGVVLEEVTGEQVDVFEMWSEMNPGKTFDDFTAILRQSLHKHSKKQEIKMIGTQDGLPIYALIAEGITLMTFVGGRNPNVCFENRMADFEKFINEKLEIPEDTLKKEGILAGYKKARANTEIIRTEKLQQKFKYEIEEVTKKMVELLKPLSVEQQDFALELTEKYIKVENSNSKEHLKEYTEMVRRFLR